jgi:hypothetical protein
MSWEGQCAAVICVGRAGGTGGSLLPADSAAQPVNCLETLDPLPAVWHPTGMERTATLNERITGRI